MFETGALGSMAYRTLAFFFGLPFMIAGMFSMLITRTRRLIWYCSLANEEEQMSECWGKSYCMATVSVHGA